MSDKLNWRQVIGNEKGYKLAELDCLQRDEVTIDKFIELLEKYKQRVPNPENTKISICGGPGIFVYVDTEDNLIIDYDSLDGELEDETKIN